MQKIIENYLNHSLILNLSPNFSFALFLQFETEWKIPWKSLASL